MSKKKLGTRTLRVLMVIVRSPENPMAGQTARIDAHGQGRGCLHLLHFSVACSCKRLAGNISMEKKMETTMVGFIGLGLRV